jgi:hypothetical protein
MRSSLIAWMARAENNTRPAAPAVPEPPGAAGGAGSGGGQA